ncbi:SDR family oxidoreductase [Croceicoccus sp. F390]|uniref:SDR family oxidoreductase n=1 Tax=Croceicoccus esteveae TaxID=3075597 RepID=A0ABU2ZIW2_9SPHN|nr:SDR family oxidoreductase [Croceicoccus sp. F390]MDT0576330.1 SDR family oxidoreductase [Croceicoccus sp. F390]
MSGKNAFVVGATGGLGRASAVALAEDFGGIALGYRSNVAAAEELAATLPFGCEGWPTICDLADPASIRSSVAAAVDHFGSIDALVYAAGVTIEQPFVSQIEDDQWREVIETELLGLTRIVAEVLPLFRTQGGGNFVILVSVANYTFPPGDALSSVPKAGMEALGRAIAKEEGKFGIRANMVAPGIIDAGLGAHFLQTLYTPDIWESQKKAIALRHFGNSEDVAEAVRFLASDRAAYITGQTIIVDGGFSL